MPKSKKSDDALDVLVPPEAIQTYEHFKQWAAQQERFANAIPRRAPKCGDELPANDLRRNDALIMREWIGEAIRCAGRNLRLDKPWRDEAVSNAMNKAVENRAYISNTQEVIQRERAQKISENGSSKKKEIAWSRITEVARVYGAIKKKHPRWGAKIIREHLLVTSTLRPKPSQRSLDTYLAKARRQGLIPR